MNIKKIKTRVNLNYQEIVEKIVDDKSLTAGDIVVWLIRELTVLQKYILDLLIDKIKTQIKMLEE